MHRKLCLSVLAVVSLSACGDGPPDCLVRGECGAAPIDGSGLLVIDATNGIAAAVEGYFAVLATTDAAAFLVRTGVGSTAATVSPKSGASAAIRSAMSLMALGTAVDPFGPTTYNCPVSGTFTVSGDVTDMNTVTEGDFYLYEATACNSGQGFTVDGTFTVRINAIQGDVASGLYLQDQTIIFTNFQATGDGTVTLTGDHNPMIDLRGDPVLTTLVSGNSLTVDQDNITVTMSNFGGDDSLDTTVDTYEFDAQGRVSSSILERPVDYATTQRFVQAVNAFPSSGSLLVTGANGTRITMTAVDAENVRFDAVYENGATDTIATTWISLFN